MPSTPTTTVTKIVKATESVVSTIVKTAIVKSASTTTVHSTYVRTKHVTTTLPTTTVTVFTATSTVTSVATGSPAWDSCSMVYALTGDSDPPQWDIYYGGQGNTSDSAVANANPNGAPVKTSTINTTLDDWCGAANACVHLASRVDSPISYDFDIHFRESTQAWECWRYSAFGPQAPDPSWFSIKDEDVLAAYGCFLDPNWI